MANIPSIRVNSPALQRAFDALTGYLSELGGLTSGDLKDFISGGRGIIVKGSKDHRVTIEINPYEDITLNPWTLFIVDNVLFITPGFVHYRVSAADDCYENVIPCIETDPIAPATPAAVATFVRPGWDLPLELGKQYSLYLVVNAYNTGAATAKLYLLSSDEDIADYSVENPHVFMLHRFTTVASDLDDAGVENNSNLGYPILGAGTQRMASDVVICGDNQKQLCWGVTEAVGGVNLWNGVFIVAGVFRQVYSNPTYFAVTGDGFVIVKASRSNPADVQLVLQGDYDVANDTYIERPICAVTKTGTTVRVICRYSAGKPIEVSST